MKWIITCPCRRSGFLTVGLISVDDDPIATESITMDDLDISHVTVDSISEQRISIPI